MPLRDRFAAWLRKIMIRFFVLPKCCWMWVEKERGEILHKNSSTWTRWLEQNWEWKKRSWKLSYINRTGLPTKNFLQIVVVRRRIKPRKLGRCPRTWRERGSYLLLCCCWFMHAFLPWSFSKADYIYVALFSAQNCIAFFSVVSFVTF
jgi:hypothetical protein